MGAANIIPRGKNLKNNTDCRIVQIVVCWRIEGPESCELHVGYKLHGGQSFKYKIILFLF
jgi:hypothetical protein